MGALKVVNMKTLDFRAARRRETIAPIGRLWLCVLVWLQAAQGLLSGGDTGGTVPTSPYFRILCINELQSNNERTLTDLRKEADPWLELYNPGTKPLLLDQFSLSDNYYQFQRWRFPRGAAIDPGRYVVVWLDGQPEQGNADQFHSSLRLNPQGGALALSMLVNGRPVVVDYVDYPALGVDLSYGIDQTPNSGGSRRIFARPTPGRINATTPSVVINEWYSVPPNQQPGWFELYNPSREVVSLDGLSVALATAAGGTNRFQIPKGRRVAAGGFLRVWADARPDLNATDFSSLHVSFRLPAGSFVLQLLTSSETIDQITAIGQDPKRPEARYPDGARFFEIVDVATPAAPNVGRPRFTEGPTDHEGRAGEPWTWRTTAIGTQPIRYQWYFNQDPIAGATSSSLDFKLLEPADTGTYEVRAVNVAGSSSDFARLLVHDPPRVVVDAPADFPITIGKTLRLPAGASGTSPFQFQWKRNGVNIPRANFSSYTKDVIDLEDGGSYTAVVRNGAGVVLSQPVRVLIDVPVVKGGDLFKDPIDLQGQTKGTVRGSNREATRELGEPSHDGNPGGRSVWFRWQALKEGIASFDTRGSTFDTVLAVYTGPAVDQLRRVESDDDSGGYYTSALRFNASPRVNYFIAVDGYGGDTNDFLLSWSLESTTAQLPVILNHPDSISVMPGSKAEFRVAAINARGYQWLFNGNRLIGQTKEILTIDKADAGDIGLYSVLVSSPEQQVVQSRPARLQLSNLPREPWLDKYEFPFQAFSVPNLTEGDQPGLVDVPSVSVTAGTIGWTQLSLGGSSTQSMEPPPCGTIGGFSMFQQFTMAENATMIVDTVGSTNDTVLTIYTLGSKVLWKYETCNANSSNSLVSFNGRAGRSYYAFVDTPNTDTNSRVMINWRAGHLPRFLSAPFTNTIDLGTPLALTAPHVAVPAVTSAQWLLDGAILPGETSTSFPSRPATTEHTGVYSLILSNAMGAVTGVVANISVRVPFQLSASPVPGKEGTDVMLEGMAEQGFLVEVSADLLTWCYFHINTLPLDPFEYVLSRPEGYSKLFFRCQPWPTPLPYVPVQCLPGYP